MSGGIKSGLLFAALQAPMVGVFSAIGFLASFLDPRLGVAGVICCGPLGTIIFGMLAGYLGVRWNGEPASVKQGLLAGGIAGLGALLGSVLVYVVLLLLVNSVAQSNPEVYQEAMRQVLEQQPESGITTADVQNLMSAAFVFLGLCSGSVALLFSLGAGALGGWITVRQRKGAAQPPIGMPPAAG